ncbi:MAG TPA: hypothetical protein VGI88_04020, partial [Verrucomicrobiae bacterium]
MLICLLVCLPALSVKGQTSPKSVADFQKNVHPILENYCSDCHFGDEKKGSVSFSDLKSDNDILNHDLWLRVLKNLRANLMPPTKKTSRPTPEE